MSPEAANSTHTNDSRKRCKSNEIWIKFNNFFFFSPHENFPHVHLAFVFRRESELSKHFSHHQFDGLLFRLLIRLFVLLSFFPFLLRVEQNHKWFLFWIIQFHGSAFELRTNEIDSCAAGARNDRPMDHCKLWLTLDTLLINYETVLCCLFCAQF